MNENKANQIFENDFKKWYSYSQCYENPELTLSLKRVITNQKSESSFILTKQVSAGETLLIINENYNPIALSLQGDNINKFISFLASFNYAEKNTYSSTEKSNKYKSANVKSQYENISEIKHIQKDSKQYNKIFQLLNKASSENKTKHSLSFSLIAFALLQLVILPGNINNTKFGDWAKIFFFGIMILFCILSLFSYSTSYNKVKQYKDINSLVSRFNSFIWLFTFFEVVLIDLIIDNEFNFWFSLFLLFITQFAALIISLFLSMIIYFAKGGKMIMHGKI